MVSLPVSSISTKKKFFLKVHIKGDSTKKSMETALEDVFRFLLSTYLVNILLDLKREYKTIWPGICP